MVCPKCGGAVRVVDIVHVEGTNEDYRKKECNECKHIFYTTEFEVEADDNFSEEWYVHHRFREGYKRRYKYK